MRKLLLAFVILTAMQVTDVFADWTAVEREEQNGKVVITTKTFNTGYRYTPDSSLSFTCTLNPSSCGLYFSVFNKPCGDATDAVMLRGVIKGGGAAAGEYSLKASCEDIEGNTARYLLIADGEEYKGFITGLVIGDIAILSVPATDGTSAKQRFHPIGFQAATNSVMERTRQEPAR